MKKSSRPWIVAFVVSLLPATFFGLVAVDPSVTWNNYFAYVGLSISLLTTIPIWGAAIVRAKRRKHRQDWLSLTALLVSYGLALVVESKGYYWQPASLTSIVLLSGWIFHSQMLRVGAAKKDLMNLIPSKVAIIEGREVEHTDASELEIGEVVLVRPGLTFPADGYVIQGESVVSESAVTGDPSEIVKVPGDWVLGGSENLAGRGSQHQALTVRVSSVGDDLVVGELTKAYQNEDFEEVKFRRLGEISTVGLTLTTIAATMVLVGLELILGKGLLFSLSSGVGVLAAAQIGVVANATPLAVVVSSIKATGLSVLVRSRAAFERLATINHVVFNKTGVLTRGHRSVGSIHLARNTSIGSEDELLALAASVEMGTSHELGHLIIQEAAKRGLELPRVSDIAALPGLGVSARFDGSLVQVGNAGMVNVSGINMNPYDLFRVSNAYGEGSSVVFVSIDELLVGYIEFPDQLRANSAQAIAELSGKYAITVLSGDATAVVEKVTTTLGLTDFAAEVLSTRKADWLKERQASGSKILLVGDGHYDAAALAEAEVALAFGSGHNVHPSSAQLIQISQDPLTVTRLVRLSKLSQRANIFAIFGGLGVSVALAVAAGFGVPAVFIGAGGLVASWYLNRSQIRLLK